jgi:hypothetical protein
MPKAANKFADTENLFEIAEDADRYGERHGIRSAANLTVTDEEVAALLTEHLAPRIRGRTVVEIGGGIGLLGLHMATVAERVFCIEANPMWSFVFAAGFLKRKPKNLSYLFGAADEFVGCIKADVAVICTHSGVADMMRAGALFAPVVIDVYGELVDANPEAFDKFAREMRLLV